ncbi:FadR/GntR family transcriptional regulator [Corynebacterium endometrii]|uniref:HTH-type transcriptional regulator LutR n=1 Tax=Corynebacterium endometrii TaxID=2488819 RepID=A0A4P7QDZ1_9CORY|nr:GntR family transcriptional regulator [Corynebacterium endometrii]QCB27775.1 HTH-type transcriptional regulator LutR [Corynebacterium endometrii]
MATTRAHEKVLDWVTSQLAAGQLTIGDRLPAERTLAETLGVSRNSLREALRVLEAMGVLQSATGSGHNSGTIITAAPEQAFGMAMGLQLASRQMRPEHIFRTRLLLETAAVSQSDPAQLDVAAINDMLDAMDDPDMPIQGFLRLDAEFHVALSRAAENPLLSTLMGAVSLAISDYTLELSHRLPDWQATARRLQREHRGVLEAMVEGDGAAASERVERHIRGYYRETNAEA